MPLPPVIFLSTYLKRFHLIAVNVACCTTWLVKLISGALTDSFSRKPLSSCGPESGDRGGTSLDIRLDVCLSECLFSPKRISAVFGRKSIFRTVFLHGFSSTQWYWLVPVLSSTKDARIHFKRL